MIVGGDMHLSHHIWLGQRGIRDDALVAFETLVNYAIEWYTPLVLAGDIFDEIRPDPSVVQFFRQQMERCQDARVKVYAIQGNHDKRDTPWFVANNPWVVFFGDGRPVDINGIRCVGFDYALKDQIMAQLEQLAQLDEPPQILFLHQAVRQALGWEGAWNCDLDWVPPGIPLTIMGDIHTPWERQIREQQLAIYTNATHPRSLAERGPKGCVLVNSDLSFTRLLIPGRPIERFNLLEVSDVQQVTEWLDRQLSEHPVLPPAAWCYHTSICTAEIGRIRREYDGRAFVVPELVDTPEELTMDQQLAQQFAEEAKEDLVSVTDALNHLIDPQVEPDAHRFTLDLLESVESPLDVIRARRTQYFTTTE